MERNARLAAALKALIVALSVSASAPAGANGRFPAAQFLVGHGAGPGTRLALRTTFGVIVSDDDGRTFHWWCEQALRFGDNWDPALAFTADGALHVGVEGGLTRVGPDCSIGSPATVSRRVADLATGADGRAVFALEGVDGDVNRVLVSRDEGRTYEPAASLAPGVFSLTLDVAPSSESRVYVTGRSPETPERAAHAVLLRSDDGGRTFASAVTDFYPLRDVFLGGVDARDPDVVWVRHPTEGGGGLVRRSRDGGRTFEEVARTGSPVNGFALAPDGRVWVGSVDGGVERSDDGGRTFARVFDTHVQCLRYHAGALYICADWRRDGAALYRWRDGATAPEALLRFTDVRASVDCPDAGAGSPSARCAERWPAQLGLFTRFAGDASLDARPPGAAMDAGPDAGALPPPRPQCGCRVPGAPANASRPGAWCASALALALALAFTERVTRRSSRGRARRGRARARRCAARRP